MVCFKVEVGISMTKLGNSLEPPYVRRTDILLVIITELADKSSLINVICILYMYSKQ